MRPDYLSSGDEARLIPVVKETNKEIRLLSPVLCAFRLVPDYAREILEPIGLRIGTRTSVECFVEVVFKGADLVGDRPDGLIVLNTGRSTWRALVEAKYGKSSLSGEQVSRYLELAKKCGIDAVITISNQFAATPRHSPISVSSGLTKKVDLYHVSWSSIFTGVELLISSGAVEDPEQALVLHELYRYLAHESSGIEGFTQMNSGWRELTKTLAAHGRLSKSDPAVLATASDWIEEQKDLCLILAREIQTPVSLKLTRKHAESQEDWRQSIVKDLIENRVLAAEFQVPDAASNIQLRILVAAKVLTMSMVLKAPGDRKSTSARVNWVIRQLAQTEDERITLRLHWPGRRPARDFKLGDLRSDSDLIKTVDDDSACNYIEVMLVEEVGGRFSGNRTFIESLEAAFRAFYEQVGQNLKAWQAPAPRTVKAEEIVERDEEEKIKEIREEAGSDPKLPDHLF